MNTEVHLCGPVRTAIGTSGGSLSTTPATQLGATAIRATLARSKLPDGLKRGPVTLCIGGAQAAMAVECPP